MLSKREAKCRTKIIQEGHYNKAEQRILDDDRKTTGRSYAETYAGQRAGKTYTFMAVIAATRLSAAFATAGVSSQAAADSFTKFADAARPIYQR